MQLIHRVGERYLNFNLLLKMMLSCSSFKGFFWPFGDPAQTVELQSGLQI